MSGVLFFFGCIAIVVGLWTWGIAETAIHQVLGAVVGLAACVLIGSASIIEAVDKVRETVKPKSAESTEGETCDDA